MKSARAAPRKHIVSARIKPPSESSSEGNRGFKYHLWKAIKRTVLNVLLVVILFVVLFFTDGFWLCESPFQISPINLSDVEKTTTSSKSTKKDESSPPTSAAGENFELMFVDHLFENVVSGPESFAFYGDYLITTCADGKVLMLNPNNQSEPPTVLYSRCDTPVSEKHCGRPLGIEMVNNRSIIFADSYHGLFSVNLETKKQTRLFPRHDDNDFDLMNSTFKFLNSLQVHEDAIYITHSSAVYQREEFVNAFLEPDCSGGIIKLDRKSLEHSLILSGICFPNGISTDSLDPDYLIVSELAKARLLRVNKHTGEYTVFADGLPGYPDNIRTDGKGFWIGFSAVRFSAVSEMIYERPFVRLVLKHLNSMRLMNPVNLVPPYGLVGYVNSKGKLVRLLHDPSGQGSQKISEAAPYKGHLYIGSYHPKFKWISRYQMKT